MNSTLASRLESWMKIVNPLLAIAAFLWGIYTYNDTVRQQIERENLESERIAETRLIEATRPYLDKQLALYTEVTRITSIIATSKDEEKVKASRSRFFELYWGELALVEGAKVRDAMVSFREALDAKVLPSALAPLALNLANECRGELAASWRVNNWRPTQPNLK